MLDINISTPYSVMDELKTRFKQKRLELDLTQEGLSLKSAVSLGSLKRFESTGKISLESLLKISFVLECLEDFLDVAKLKEQKVRSIDELFLHIPLTKTRGTKK